MTGIRRRWLAVLIGVAALSSAGYADALTAADHGTPVFAPAPAHPPKAAVVKGACTVPSVTDNESPYTTTDRPLLWVRAHPTGLVAIWLPGLNAKHCVARRTTSGGHLAQRVAGAIRQSAPFPPETLWCPNDDGAQVRLYFQFAKGRDQYADVALGGCRPIAAPGRAARWTDAAVTKALRHAAPVAWRSYLGS
jgi:hypothetical protein